METREIKIVVTEWLICKYNINVCAFMELNFVWSKVNLLENLASWFQGEERELCSVTTHNKTKFNQVFRKTPAWGNWTSVQAQISPICQDSINQSKGLRQMVSMVCFL